MRNPEDIVQKIKLFFLASNLEKADAELPYCLSTGIDSDLLKWAFSRGLFQWSAGPIAEWHCPDPRCLLFLNEFTLSSSLKRTLKKTSFQITINQSSELVLDGCIERKLQLHEVTWMTDEYRNSMKALFKSGFAHTISAWSGERLVGGLIGINIGRFFSAESMYFLESGASLHCLVYLIDYLIKNDYKFLDVQVESPLVRRIGARNVSKQYFLEHLKEARELPPASFHID